MFFFFKATTQNKIYLFKKSGIKIRNRKIQSNKKITQKLKRKAKDDVKNGMLKISEENQR